MKYRSRSEIVVAILKSALKGSKKTKLMYDAYLTYTQFGEYSKMLVKNKLLTFNSDERVYTTTEKGRQLIAVSKQLVIN